MQKRWKSIQNKGSHARTSNPVKRVWKKLVAKVKSDLLTQDTDILFLKCCAVMLIILALVIASFDDVEVEYAEEEHTPGYMQVDFAYEATTYPWQELGYTDIISYRAAFDEAIADTEGIAEEAINMYSAVISEEQIEQLRDYESHMLSAVTFKDYNEYFDLFTEVCGTCEEELSKLYAAQVATSSSSSSSSSNKSYIIDWSNAKEFIIYHESRGDYTATNGKHYGAYQLDISYLGGDLSAENQDRVAEEYVMNRYGSWENAMAFWQANGWY